MATLGGLGPCQAGAVSFARNRMKAARLIGALSFLPTKDDSKRSRPHTSTGTVLLIGAITRETPMKEAANLTAISAVVLRP